MSRICSIRINLRFPTRQWGPVLFPRWWQWWISRLTRLIQWFAHREIYVLLYLMRLTTQNRVWILEWIMRFRHPIHAKAKRTIFWHFFRPCEWSELNFGRISIFRSRIPTFLWYALSKEQQFQLFRFPIQKEKLASSFKLLPLSESSQSRWPTFEFSKLLFSTNNGCLILAMFALSCAFFTSKISKFQVFWRFENVIFWLKMSNFIVFSCMCE